MDLSKIPGAIPPTNEIIRETKELLGINNIGVNTMDNDLKEKLDNQKRKVAFAVAPATEMRAIVDKMLDINNDGKVDSGDLKSIIKDIVNWSVLIFGFVLALSAETGSININSFSGWLTIGVYIIKTITTNYRKRIDNREVIEENGKWKGLSMALIDLSTNIIFAKEDSDIRAMLAEGISKIKSELYLKDAPPPDSIKEEN